MEKLVGFLLAIMYAVTACAMNDYAVNVWISTKGTNVTYLLRNAPASLVDISDAVKKVANFSSDLTVHVIADKQTSMNSLFDVSGAIHNGGLTNILVSVFWSPPKGQKPAKLVEVKGMRMRIFDIHDFVLQKESD